MVWEGKGFSLMRCDSLIKRDSVRRNLIKRGSVLRNMRCGSLKGTVS